MAASERYERIKENVTSAQVAHDHGREVERDGQGREKALCPFHNDHDPSLKLFQDGGYKCFSCGESGDSISLEQHLGGHGSASEAAGELESRYGLERDVGANGTAPRNGSRPQTNGTKPAAENSEKPKKSKRVKNEVGRKEVARWNVRDKDGVVRAQHVRYLTWDEEGNEGKKYFYHNPDGSYSRGDIKSKQLPLYLSEKVHEYDPKKIILLVEGEKAADAAAEAGLPVVATTAGTEVVPDPEYLEILRDYKVVLWCDADDPGHRHMADVAEALEGIASEVRFYEWPKASEQDDAADHPAVISADPDLLEGLRQALRDAPVYDPEKHRPEKPAPKPTAAATNTPAAKKGFALTDYGNAERLVSRHGQDLHYLYAWGKWLVWDGRRWSMDDMGEVDRRAKETVRSIYAEAAAEADDSARKAIAAHARASESRARVDAMLAHTHSEPGIPIRHNDLDADPWLGNVGNGTLDLRTGELRDHDREDLITKTVPFDYDPDASAPRFEEFLQQVLPDPEVRDFVQQYAGYSLTGSTSERVLCFLHGGGKNGKSTLVEALREAAGEYAQNTTVETILSSKGSQIPNDVAALKGARLVSAAEPEKNRRMAESKVKNLTGSDTVTARFMRGEFFEFKPEFKLWISMNHKPVIIGTDDAIWDRIRMVPFEQRFADNPDTSLPAKLAEERAGIFAWMIRGALAWYENGLGCPEAVAEATQEYREQMDTLGEFFDENCVLHPDAFAPAGELYKRYERWCDSRGEDSESQTAFGGRLSERGFQSFKFKSGPHKDRKGWYGIGLKAKDPDPDGGSRADSWSSTKDSRNAKTDETSSPGDSATPKSSARADSWSSTENTAFAGKTGNFESVADSSGPKNSIDSSNHLHEAAMPKMGPQLSALSAPDVREGGYEDGEVSPNQEPPALYEETREAEIEEALDELNGSSEANVENAGGESVEASESAGEVYSDEWIKARLDQLAEEEGIE